MTASNLALIGVLITVTLLGILASYDPKRLRVNRRKDVQALSPRLRRMLATIAFTPGVGFAIAGHWSIFLIWLGFSCIAGWLLALSFARMAGTD